MDGLVDSAKPVVKVACAVAGAAVGAAVAVAVMKRPYKPGRVWKHVASGGKFASINAPTAGARCV